MNKEAANERPHGVWSSPKEMRESTIFVVDDEAHNRILAERALSDAGYRIRVFTDGDEVLSAIDAGDLPDLVVSDVMMERMGGIELCGRIKEDDRLSFTPIILVTALSSIEDKVRGLECGADDFLHKPYHPLELGARVRSLLRIKTLHSRLVEQNDMLGERQVHLEALVRERTRELDDLTIGLVSSFEKVNELNDDDTGKHIRRVCEYSRVLAIACGLPESLVQKIHRYASLHDVGKVAIGDAILKKRGRLNPVEWKEMRRHPEIGYELLRLAGTDTVAQNIARYHHESWDGTGYPMGLKGEDIPIEARIITVADVFDALTTRRCYKPAFSLSKTQGIIQELSGKHLDPDLVALYFAHQGQFEAIRGDYRDTASSEELGLEETPIKATA
mgnify:CR=1 FL=1